VQEQYLVHYSEKVQAQKLKTIFSVKIYELQPSRRGVMKYKYSSLYQNWIYPNLWIIVICVGVIVFFFSIWLSIWLSGLGG